MLKVPAEKDGEMCFILYVWIGSKSSEELMNASIEIGKEAFDVRFRYLKVVFIEIFIRICGYIFCFKVSVNMTPLSMKLYFPAGCGHSFSSV